MAYVNGANAQHGGGSFTSLSLAYTPANAGNTLVISIALNSSATALTPSTTGAGGSAFVAYSGNPVTNTNVPNVQLATWTQASCAAGLQTFTVNWTTASGFQVLTITEFSARGPSFLIDATGTGADAAATFNHTNGSVSTTISGDDLYFVGLGTGTAATVTATGSWIADQTTTTNRNIITEYQQNVGLATVNGTYHSSTQYFSMGILLALSKAQVRNMDSNGATISGNGPGTLVANNACVVGDLLLCEWSLTNIGSNTTFTPTITDSVNSGIYQKLYQAYNAAGPGGEVYGASWLIANAPGVPTVTLAGSGIYSNGNMNYVRWSGFSTAPTPDGTPRVTSGNSTTPSGSFTSAGTNELVIALTFGGGSYTTDPPGWNIVNNAGGGFIISPYWVENPTPAGSSFTGGVLNASEPWFVVMAGFASGAIQQTLGNTRTPGPGPNPNAVQTFVTRLLSTSPPGSFHSARGGSVAGGFGHGIPQGVVGAFGGSVAGGLALGSGIPSRIGRQQFRGPGPSPDWQTTFTPRVLALTTPTVPFGVTAAVGGSVAGGFAFATVIGVGAAIGGSVAGGFAESRSISTGAAVGGSVAGGFANYIIVSAIGGSVAGGYASPFLGQQFVRLDVAIAILANAGFTIDPVLVWQYSNVVPYYYIIGQLPTAGTVIPYQNPPIKLTVSAGPPPPVPPIISIPPVVGLPLLSGVDVLAHSMLNIGTITYILSQTIPPNQITAQSPIAGTNVTQFTSIDLTVCSGPLMDILIGDPTTVPNVTTP